MTEKETLLALTTFVPFGPARLGLLINYFGSAKRVWKASRTQLLKVGLSPKIVETFLKHKENFPRDYFDSLRLKNISYITQADDAYPEKLKAQNGSPVTLYLKGNVDCLLEKSVAIVGSRKMTSYGKEVADIFTRDLVLAGVAIISGLARGIDTVAHRSTVDSGGKTIAVLGCGLDSIYPPENTNLAREIVEKGGSLISEYPLGYPAFPVNFANRNRIVSGLSDAVLVIEGAEKSGTLLTASHAADQGKTVFAVPGQITSPMSGAPHFLLRNGAKMALTPKDILEELGWQNIAESVHLRESLPQTPEESKLLKILEGEPLHLDELVRISSLTSSTVSARLVIMEMKGFVKNLGGGVYKKC